MLVKFISRCSALFNAIVNGIVSLIFSLDSLFVFRNVTDFCTLTFLFCNFAGVCYSNRFFVTFLGFSIHTFMSSAKKIQFYFFLCYLVAFHFLFLSITLPRIFSIMLNRIGENGQPGLILDFRRKFFRC